MAEIRHLIDNPAEVWEWKDDLYTTSLLNSDPLKLYKGKFVDYMKVKARALYDEYSQQHDHAVAVHLTNLKMRSIAEAWKAAAARVNKEKA